jgi:hypothetical protein
MARAAGLKGGARKVRQRLMVLVLCGSFVLTAIASASGPAVHEVDDVTGDVFICEDATYTVTSGKISFVFHEGESASGNHNFTATIVPKNVTLIDSAGNTYRAVGAVWFGGTLNAKRETFQSTFTFKLNIVGTGGKADTVNLVGHESSDGANFFLDQGTCEEPDE